ISGVLHSVSWLMKPRTNTVARFDKSPCFSATQVAESFLELVTDETKDGEALIVQPGA
uniref:Uncharacterized protein n=1 Tax=Tetraodon nigroviridis TaxID=99883 RepID=H3BWX5_TETNG